MIDPHSQESLEGARPWEAWLDKWFVRLLIPAILINISGVFVRIIEPDGALYATISRTIAETGDFTRLFVEGKDWLDKPHFPFWVAALSMKIFGINSFAYKLPALLFWAAGGWYVYRLAMELYGRATAQLSVLVYVSAAHLIISNNDVRAEPYLTGLVVGAVYHFFVASRRERVGWHLVAGSLLSACAMMTKGPFVLVTIGGGFILDWIVTKDWVQFRSVRWWIALALIGVFILPEIYCLYVQFDLHPEKVVFGRRGVSGIRFFFWDSQFGRFFNTGPIKGAGDPFFYFHTLLWAFLPWPLLLYAAVYRRIRGVVSTVREKKTEGRGRTICLGAAVLSFAMFSMSRFQLPYYLNILFPFFAILTAEYLLGMRRRGAIRAVVIIQGVITVILSVLMLGLCWWLHFKGWPYWMGALLLLSVLPFFVFRGSTMMSAMGRSFWMVMVVFLYIDCCLYPPMLHYQSGMEAADYIREEAGARPVAGKAAAGTVYLPVEGPPSYSLEFYAPCAVERVSVDSLPAMLQKGPPLFFMTSKLSDTLTGKGYRVQIVKEFPHFHITQLTGEFVNYKTRGQTYEWFALVWIFPKGPMRAAGGFQPEHQ